MAVKIPNYEDYLIHSDGRVFSLKSNHFLKATTLKTGYQVIELRNDKEVKKFLIHRLVAEAFIPNPLNLPQVNHIDECKTNNNVNNLEWCTAQYNMTYNNLQNRRMQNTNYNDEVFKRVGKQVGILGCKPLLQFSLSGKFIKRFKSITEANEHLKVKNSHITDCCKGKRKTSNGYIWKYESEVIV